MSEKLLLGKFPSKNGKFGIKNQFGENLKSKLKF